MDWVEVKGISVYGYHGCMDEEGVVGTPFEVDIEVGGDFQRSAITDDLNDTADYVALRKIAEEEVKIRAKLIETVAKRILNRILQEHAIIQSARVTLKKYNPPIDGVVRYVSIKMESHR